MKMKFCEVIRIKRELLGMTQQDVADMVGVSAGCISSFENGAEVSRPIVDSIVRNINRAIDNLSDSERDLFWLQFSTDLLVDAVRNGDEVDATKQISNVIRNCSYILTRKE